MPGGGGGGGGGNGEGEEYKSEPSFCLIVVDIDSVWVDSAVIVRCSSVGIIYRDEYGIVSLDLSLFLNRYYDVLL